MRPIHLASLDKIRPALILTRDLAVGRHRTVTVAAITSRVHGLATGVIVGAMNGLDHESAVNMDNIFTIDYSALGRRLGLLLDTQETALRNALSHAFDLDDQAE